MTKNITKSLVFAISLVFVVTAGATGCSGKDGNTLDLVDTAEHDSSPPSNDGSLVDAVTPPHEDDADTSDSTVTEDAISPDAMDGGSKPDGTANDGGTKPPPNETGNLNDLPVECQKPIVDGVNTEWIAGDWERSFHASFPKNTSTAPAIVFLFHGFTDNVENFLTRVPLDPDTDPTFPLIIIAPYSTKLHPFTDPQGLEWDLTNGEHQSTNRDVLLVKSVVACLKKQNKADPTRVYSVGFSAGSIFTSLLHTTFQKDLAAVVTLSGMWYNDPEQLKLIELPLKLHAKWDSLEPQYGGNVLVAHGGPEDKYAALGVINYVNFNATGKAAVPFLTKAKRDIVYCTHEQKHIPPPELTPSRIVAFLKAHKKGEKSPYLKSGIDAELAKANCTLKAAE